MILRPLFAALLLFPFFARAESLIKDKDRIVFIGDSITGQGMLGGGNAWVALIGEGIALARPKLRPTLTGLGGSGATVGAWQNFEKRSRTGPVALDVKEIDVGETLDAGAEVIVIMLGMNDVLAPALDGEPEGFDKWIARYTELIESIRARSHPRVIALATVSPCTEDPASPKNLAIAEMNRRLSGLAREKGFALLPVNETSLELLYLGRQWKSDFRVTSDFVHPNRAGHLAIAAGMLRGLSEEKAATLLLEKHSAAYLPAEGDLPTFSHILTRKPGSPDDATHTFLVEYHWTGAADPKVTATAPSGWTVKPKTLSGAQGTFELTGPLDRVTNDITLSATATATATAGNLTRIHTFAIPAGWRVSVGQGKADGWVKNSEYDPANDSPPIDEMLAGGEGFTKPVAFPKGEPSPWSLYVATGDYTGGNSPGSIDLAAVDFFRHGSQACGARWIHSDHERPVNLELGTKRFAGMYSLSVWLNGESAFAGKMEKLIIPVTLRKGWNQLNFRSTFIQWQWQFSIGLVGTDGDELTDLRYATKPSAAP